MGMPDQSVSLPISMKSTRGRWTMTAVILGSGIVFLDSTVVNVALPHIGKDLPSHLFGVLEGESYVYSAYLLTLSALLILAGALSDYYGRRKMFALGLVGFGAMSLACGLAPNLELLILFRILQGAAGALLVPGSLSIITSSFAGEDQGKAFGLWAGASAATTILGPVIVGKCWSCQVRSCVTSTSGCAGAYWGRSLNWSAVMSMIQPSPSSHAWDGMF